MNIDYESHKITVDADDINNWCDQINTDPPANVTAYCPITLRFSEDVDNCMIFFPDYSMIHIHADYFSDSDITNAVTNWLYERDLIDSNLSQMRNRTI